MNNRIVIFVFAGMSILFSCENKKLTDLDQHLKIDEFEAEYSKGRGAIKEGYFGGVKITDEIVDGKNYFEGDILIPDQLINNDKLNRQHQAISKWNNNTGLKFIKRTVETDYVVFTFSADGCYSNLWEKGGRQFIRLSNDCKKGNVKHEIGNALGLMHQHSNPNKNINLMVHWNRLKNNRAHNYSTGFQKNNPNKIQKGNIDFTSIMMYSCYGFSRSPNLPTLTKSDGISTWPLNRSALSKKDIEIMNLLY